MPDCPPTNKLTYSSYYMDMWWFAAIGPLSYQSFEVRCKAFNPGGSAGLMLFQMSLPGDQNQNPPIQPTTPPVFVLETKSSSSSKHYMQVQSQVVVSDKCGVPSTYVIATCIDAPAHAVPDPNDLNWYPITTLANNTGIPIGYPTSYLLPPTEISKQSTKNGENSKNTTDPPAGYPNGYFEQDGMLFGLALVDLAALFSDSKTLSSLQDAINNYSLSYTQARLLQTTLRTTIMPPASTTPPSTTR